MWKFRAIARKSSDPSGRAQSSSKPKRPTPPAARSTTSSRPPRSKTCFCTRAPAEIGKGLIQRLLRGHAGRRVINLPAVELLHPVIRARIKPQDIESVLDERHKRQEQCAVEAVLVEPRGLDVDVATSTTPRAKSASNNRPRIIASAISSRRTHRSREPSFFGQLLRHRHDGVTTLHLARFQLLAIDVDALMHIRHEGVEMRPPFAPDAEFSWKRSISMVLPRPTEPQR